MSLILEALRKSEAERRRGQAPDLLTEAAPVAPVARAGMRSRHLIPLAAGGTVLAAVLLVLLWSRTPAAPESAATASASPSVAASTARATDTPVEPPRPLQPPRMQPTPAAAPVATTTARAPASAQPIAADTPARVDATADARAEDTARAAPPLPRPAPAASPPPPAAVAAFTSPDLPLRLSELSTDDRQQLPPLKVSMHMWAQESGSRFAIIDGTRVNEGDRIGDATVEAIQQDGVMLSWRGRRISLPIR
jgi:general secretion pathway protein B